MEASDQELFARFTGNVPASPALVDRCQASVRFRLPGDYRQFLQRMNGGEGFIGRHYLMLWRIEEVVKENTGTYYAEAAPGLSLFGSDGGGEAFAFDTRFSPASIVIVPFIGMELSAAYCLAPTFNSFLKRLFSADDLF
jgi:SMI1 / KNR4 family (SUKH-1)